MRIPTTPSSGYTPTGEVRPGTLPDGPTPGASSANPVTYEGIVFSREMGRGVAITIAPKHSKISLGVLVTPTVLIRETAPGHLLFADQVEYVITGYDPADATLTLELVEDYRPVAHHPRVQFMPEKES
jgi:hypothetical protein